MLQNIVPRNLEIITERNLEFMYEKNCGLSFPVDENDQPILDNEAARANYEYAIKHPEDYPYMFNKVVEYEREWWEPAHGTCVCGNEVSLVNEYQGACQCSKCGRWYNLFGQMLKNPEFWEEDY